MKLRQKITAFTLALSCLIASAAQKPNIVLFVADDFGRGSINALGADEKFVQTPHLNKLVESGLNFTNAFTTASVCTPTRYAMLTGQYSWRTNLKKGVVNNSDPLLISTKTETIGKMLQKQGYRTAAVGKWHLGYNAKDRWPLQRGFDKFYGCISGATNFFNPEAPRDITFMNEPLVNPESTTDEAYYTTDAFTDFGMRFIHEHLEA
ncbi:MAG: sulfatase-like hydrolase/transferase, partial [Lentisphaeraceae bacterium]|nr:sulfatase-like hydrolase/transferase [Lentisphaeraceae bacterium]